ncbi:MAG: NosD domain-containing protein [Candidatus Bathyarchaeia archaeon]
MLNKKLSEIILALLLFGMLTSSINPSIALTMYETIYIRADGTIEPDGAPISTSDYVTYVLTDDILSYAMDYGVVVERDNVIIDGKGYEVHALGFYGVYLNGVSNVTIKNMRIKANFYGVCLDGSSNNTIIWNSITNAVRGIYLINSLNNTIIENNITNNLENVFLDCSSNNTIIRNNMTNGVFGVVLKDESNNNTIIENKIANNNSTGISVEFSKYNVVFGNNITNNKANGMLLSCAANNNTIYYNWFVDNAVNRTKEGKPQVETSNSLNFWDNGTIGNYWNDHKSSDENGDGICEDPYVISSRKRTGELEQADHFPIWAAELQQPPLSMSIELIVAAVIIVVAVVGVAVFIIRKKKEA